MKTYFIFAIATFAGLTALIGNAQEVQRQTDPACVKNTLLAHLYFGHTAEYFAAIRRPEFQQPVAPLPDSELVIRLYKSKPGEYDAFVYHLAVRIQTGDVYVIRSGGFAGGQKFYGPVAQIDTSEICLKDR